MVTRRRTTHIIVHCAATPPDLDVGVAEIKQWHLERGFADIGYHFVIRRDGRVENGRPLHIIGAHARPWNDRSVGICLVGGVGEAGEPENNFDAAQFSSLNDLLLRLIKKFPGVAIIGHRDVPGVTKRCPSFDVKNWLRKKGILYGPSS